MRKKTTRTTRQQRRKEAAFIAVDKGLSIRKAAQQSLLSRSTFHRQYLKRNNTSAKMGRPPALTLAEENVIVQTLLRFAARGFPLTRENLLDSVALFCKRLPVERQLSLPFKDCRPSQKFAKNFARRHKLLIKFGKPSFQEGKRYRATNAVNLVSYAACLKSIIEEHNIDENRIANIDESGFSPDRDRLGSTNKKRYGTRSCPMQKKLVTFKYRNRITLLPITFADGSSGPPFWVLKGSTVPYRCIVRNDAILQESLVDCLPRGSYITCREDCPGVNNEIFVEWSRMFVEHCKDLTANNRKVLLLYDAYRPHMSLESLEILEEGGIIAFALPSHTTGTTQPLDVGLFQPFKHRINCIIDEISPVTQDEGLDVFDLCKVLRTAYSEVFTGRYIRSAFEKSGVNPFNPMKYLGVPRPLSEEEPNTVVSVEDLEKMLEKKIEERRQNIGIQPVVMSRGFVSTNKGLQLTSKDVMEKVREQEDAKRKKWITKRKAEEEDELKWIRIRRARRNERALFERSAMVYRAKVYGEPMEYPRSLEQRRKVARERTVMLKAERKGVESLTELEKKDAPWNECSQLNEY